MVTLSPAPAPHHSPVPSLKPSAPVTISPSLFVPHLHHSSQRRYSVEDTQARPTRTRPTSYNEMRLVTVTPRPLSYNTPLNMKVVSSPLTQPTVSPSTPRPAITNHQQMNTFKSYTSKQFGNLPQPVLPPIKSHLEPLLVHRGEPVKLYNQHQEHLEPFPEEINEEPKFLLKLVPNPNYKQPAEMSSRRKPSQRDVGVIPLQTESRDPNLYPYLYILSSYLPQTEHSLVVAKKS